MIMIRIILLLVCIISVLHVITCQQCKYFTHYPDDYLYNPCASVINYKYFIPIGKTDLDLLINVKLNLNNYKLKNTPVLCQEALRNYTCGLVYRKCFPGVVLGNTLTYDSSVYSPYPVKIPVMRPCELLCTKVHSKCSGSLYLLNNLLPDCNAKQDLTNGQFLNIIPKLFDSSNDYSTKCYLTGNIPIASSYELYSGQACTGFVNEVFAPDGSVLNDSYTTLIPPHYFQESLENMINAAFQSLPSWISKSCMFSLHRYICLGAFKYPQIKTLTDIFIDNNLTTLLPALANDPKFSSLLGNVSLIMPSYLHYDLCENYENRCQAFIKLANKNTLVPNCSRLSTQVNGIIVNAYPKYNQTVSVLSTSIQNYGNLKLLVQSKPNTVSYYDISSYTYETQCPFGFAVPANGDDSSCVSGTGCAVKCKFAYYTDKEWDFYEGLIAKLSIASVVVGGITIIALITTEKFSSVFTIVFFLFITWYSSMYSAIYYNTYSFDERFCKENTQVINQEDGISNCIVHGVSVTVVVFASTLVTLSFACEVFYSIMSTQRIVYSLSFRIIQVIMTLGVAFIPLSYALSNQYTGYKLGNFACGIATYSSNGEPKNLLADSVGKPLIVILVIEAIILIICIQIVLIPPCQENATKVTPMNKKHISHTNNNNYNDNIDDIDDMDNYYEVTQYQMEGSSNTNVKSEKQDFNDKWITNTSLICLTLMYCLWIPYSIRSVTTIQNVDKYQTSFQDWSTCVFKYFENTSNTTYLDICGYHSSKRPAYILNIFNIIVNFSNCLLPGVIYLISMLVKYFVKPSINTIEDADNPNKIESEIVNDKINYKAEDPYNDNNLFSKVTRTNQSMDRFESSYYDNTIDINTTNTTNNNTTITINHNTNHKNYQNKNDELELMDF